jgi:hypothetical protein
MVVRYGPIPHVDDRPWRVRFWARGSGRVAVTAQEFFHPWTWNPLQEWSFQLGAAWAPMDIEVVPPPGCTTWHLDLGNQDGGDLWLDDVFVGHSALTPLGLPPDKPAGSDAHTLLYLPFEEPLDPYRFFLKGQVAVPPEGAGRFGRSLVLGAEGYVACSAADRIRRLQGTIEFWAKLLSPGNDGVNQTLLQVAGPDGWTLRKDLYAHLIFCFTGNFQMLSTAWAEAYATHWQPAVWRHFAVCWDREVLQLFVDGKLVAWEIRPQVPGSFGDELGIGPGLFEVDDLRLSDTVRYRVPLRLDGPRRNESFAGGKGRF